MGSKMKIVCRIALGVLLIIYCYYILCMFAGMPINSDYCNLILEGKDILNGNFFLKDWNLTGISFVTTDLLYFIAGVLFWGVNAKSYVVAITLMFLMLVFASFLLMGKKRGLDILIYLAIAGLPCPFLMDVIRAHTGGVIWVFLGLAALEFARRQEMRCTRYYVLATVLFALAVCGDATSLIIIILPVILVELFDIIKQYVNSQKPGRDHIAALTVSVVSICLGLFMDKLYFALGHANKNSFLESKLFEPFEQYYAKLCVYLNALFGMFGANFTNMKLLSVNTVVYFLRSLVIIIGFLLIFYQIKQYVAGKEYDYISLVLGTGFLLISVIFIITNISVDILNSRYFAYAPSAFAVLIIRFLKSRDYYSAKKKVSRLISGTAICIGVFLLLPYFTSFPRQHISYEQEKLELVDLLEENHLTNGYAGFWNASSLTVYSKGVVSVRAVADFGSGMTMYNWFCKNSWYDETADFVIISKAEDSTFGVTPANAGNSFGEPQRVIESANYEIWIYDHDISERLI